MPLREGDLQNTVLKNLSIDEYEPKTGDARDILVLGFNVDTFELNDILLSQFVQTNPDEYLTPTEWKEQQFESEQKAEQERLEEEANDNTNRILEFLKASSILEAGINDNRLHMRGSRDIASLEIVNFGNGTDVMAEVGISESAIKTDFDKVAISKLNAMLGEMRAMPIDEYIVIYNPTHTDILVTKAS